MADQQDFLGRRGLTLSRRVLRRLNELGIFAQSQVTLEHQHLAKRYVVRGIESGGAVKDLGRYVTFCGPDGDPLPHLHPIDAIGVNGVHAVVVARVLIRIELFRAGRTCQLLITKHEPGTVEHGRRPPLENRVLFRGVNGLVDLDLLRTGGELATGSAMPEFWSRAGETIGIPALFAKAVGAATKGVTCVGCWHSHYLVAPAAVGVARAECLITVQYRANAAAFLTLLYDCTPPNEGAYESKCVHHCGTERCRKDDLRKRIPADIC